jgi:hypothetical protein
MVCCDPSASRLGSCGGRVPKIEYGPHDTTQIRRCGASVVLGMQKPHNQRAKQPPVKLPHSSEGARGHTGCGVECEMPQGRGNTRYIGCGVECAMPQWGRYEVYRREHCTSSSMIEEWPSHNKGSS